MHRNILRLVSGAFFSQALLLGATPFLTRIFKPEAFGALAVFSAYYALTIPITTLKYDAAVVLPRSNKTALDITAIVVIIATFVAALTGVMILLIAKGWLTYDAGLNLCLPVALWLGAMQTLIQQWSARICDYRHFTRSQIIGAILNVGICIAMGFFFGSRASFLVLGFVCGLAGSVVYMVYVYSDRIQLLTCFTISRLWRRAVIYSHFPGLVLPTTLLLSVGQNSLPLILKTNYSPGEIGQFALANRFLLIPAALIGGAFAEAFRAELNKRNRQRLDVSSLLSNTLRRLLVVAIPIFGVLVLGAPIIFSNIFGNGYEYSAQVAQAMAPGVAAQFIGHPFSCVFVVLRRPGYGMCAQFLTTVGPFAFLAIAAVLNKSLVFSLHTYSIASIFFMSIMLFLAFKLCSQINGRVIAVS